MNVENTIQIIVRPLDLFSQFAIFVDNVLKEVDMINNELFLTQSTDELKWIEKEFKNCNVVVYLDRDDRNIEDFINLINKYDKHSHNNWVYEIEETELKLDLISKLDKLELE